MLEKEISIESDSKPRFFRGHLFPKFKWSTTHKYFQVNWSFGNKFKIWIYVSKFRKGKLHFCFKFGNIIVIDTAYRGKKICGRLNLLMFFGNDFCVYDDSKESTSKYFV